MSRPASALAPLLAVGLALLPGLGLLGLEDAFLGDPLGELPVRLWVHETFAREGLFGAWIDEAAFPNAGVLDDPDPFGTAITALLRPIVGRVAAWNALLLGTLAANALAAWALARDQLDDPVAAVVAAVGFALAPFALTYGVASAITDQLQLWPWALALRALLRAVRGGDVREAALAGVFAGLGTVASAYNFVVFASALVPGAVALALARPRLLPIARVGAAGAVTFVLTGGGYLLWVRGLMADPSSLVSGALVAPTRHEWPFAQLVPGPGRWVSVLSDWVPPAELVVREVGSRYLRAFSPGFVLLALAGWGAWARPAARPWAAWALFSVLICTGPFLGLTEAHFAGAPVNVAWLAVYYGIPGSSELLEPSRYALCVALAGGVAAAFGAAALPTIARWLAPPAIVAELAFASGVPFPVTTASPVIPGVYAQLDTLLGPGAILELPYFDRGTDRFRREHFLFQLVHGRPIADEVLGYAPRYLMENQFTAQLLHVEKTTGEIVVPVTAPARLLPDAYDLAERGFAGIVVDPGAYATDAAWEEALGMLEYLGRPVQKGERWVWRLR